MRKKIIRFETEVIPMRKSFGTEETYVVFFIRFGTHKCLTTSLKKKIG